MPEPILSTEVLIQIWLEGTLTPEQAAELDRRLTEDPALRIRLAAELRTDAMLREIASTPSAALSQSNVSTLERSASPGARWRPMYAWLAVAAVLALAAIPLVRQRSLPLVQVTNLSSSINIERDGLSIPATEAGELRIGDTLHAPAGASATVTFRGETSRIFVEPFTRLVVRQLEPGKIFDLSYGSVRAEFSPQSTDHPARFNTSRAIATVHGTRLALIARAGATWLQVDAGRVEFASILGDEPVLTNVTAGQFAVASPGIAFQPRALPPSGRMSAPLDVGLQSGVPTGAGAWEPIEGGIRQTQLARFPDERQLGDGWIDAKKPKVYSFYYLPVTTSGHVRLSAEVEVEAVTAEPESAGNLNLWRFGFGLRFPKREISLRMQQRLETGSLQTRVITPEWQRFIPQTTTGRPEAPFVVSAGGTYRLVWEVRRLAGNRVRLQGKIWPAASPEPADWTVETIADQIEGDLGAVNLDTYRAICSFRDFKAELIP